MFAVFEAKGFQYIGSPGDKLRIPRLDQKVGEEVTFDKVLLVKNKGTEIGQPYIEGASVSGEIVEHGRYKKLIVYKFKRRNRYRRKAGHRQTYTEIMIKDILHKKKKKTKKTETKVKKKAEKEKKVSKKVSKSKKKKKAAGKTKKTVKPIKLSKIKGIGPARVKKLKKAGIKDVKSFVETDEEKLREILGNLGIEKMKKECKSLLKKEG